MAARASSTGIACPGSAGAAPTSGVRGHRASPEVRRAPGTPSARPASAVVATTRGVRATERAPAVRSTTDHLHRVARVLADAVKIATVQTALGVYPDGGEGVAMTEGATVMFH